MPNPIVVIQTSEGAIEVELDVRKAPKTVRTSSAT